MGNIKSTLPETFPNKLSNISKIFKGQQQPKIPKQPEQIKEDIYKLNTIFKKCKQIIKIRIKLDVKQLVFNQKSWEKSIVTGCIRDLGEVKKFRIAFNFQEIYELLEIFKNFNFATEIRKSLNRDSQESSDNQSNQNRNTNETPSNQEDFCVICLSKKPEVVLPCAHSFCEQCTLNYITKKQEKLCPLCRKLYEMGRQSFKKQLYEIVQSKDYEEQFIQQFRKEIYRVVNCHNARELKKILTIYEKNMKQNMSEQKQEAIQYQKIQMQED